MAEIVRMPKMSDTMTEGVIVAWHKKVGDKVKSGDLLAEIETDKAVMEFESFLEGYLLFIGVEKGKPVKVDEIIAVIGKQGEDFRSLLSANGAGAVKASPEKRDEKPAIAEKKIAPLPEQKTSSQPSGSRLKASPLAKKIAGDAGVLLSSIKGSGDEGRIIRRDVEKALTQPAVAVPAMGKEGFEDVPLSQMRKTIARRLTESKFAAPHFYLTTEAVMDRCASLRKDLADAFPDQKISYNDLIIKAVAMALRNHPAVNASWLEDRIRYHHHIHMGMAVAVEDGLLVPVIRFADQKSISMIGGEAQSMAAKARDKKLQPEEMQGNTFTISNLGMLDIDEFTAIINPPDACILAVGRISGKLVLENGLVKEIQVMKMTLSCDHRVVDGATGARFLQSVKRYLENPATMLY